MPTLAFNLRFRLKFAPLRRHRSDSIFQSLQVRAHALRPDDEPYPRGGEAQRRERPGASHISSAPLSSSAKSIMVAAATAIVCVPTTTGWALLTLLFRCAAASPVIVERANSRVPEW